MKVERPMEYDVELTTQEEHDIKVGVRVLFEVLSTMKKYECKTLYCGLPDCPTEIDRDWLEETRDKLVGMIENGGPYKMD